MNTVKKESANEMIDERNQNKTEVDQLAFEVKELKMWKQEITLHQEEEFNDEEILIEDNSESNEEIQIEDNSEAEEETQEEELIEDNYDSKLGLQGDSKNQTVYTNASNTIRI